MWVKRGSKRHHLSESSSCKRKRLLLHNFWCDWYCPRLEVPLNQALNSASSRYSTSLSFETHYWKNGFYHFFRFSRVLRQKYSKNDSVNCCETLQKLRFFNTGPSILVQNSVKILTLTSNTTWNYDLTAQRRFKVKTCWKSQKIKCLKYRKSHQNWLFCKFRSCISMQNSI